MIYYNGYAEKMDNEDPDRLKVQLVLGSGERVNLREILKEVE